MSVTFSFHPRKCQKSKDSVKEQLFSSNFVMFFKLMILFKGCDETRIENCNACQDPSPICSEYGCASNTIISRDQSKCMRKF